MRCSISHSFPSIQKGPLLCSILFAMPSKTDSNRKQSFEIIAIFMPKPHYFDFKPLYHADATSESIDLCKYTAAEV